MPSFRLDPSHLEQATREHRARVLRNGAVSVLLMQVVFLPGFLLGVAPDPTILALLCLFVLAAAVTTLRRALRSGAQLAEHFESYRLELDETGLMQRSTLIPERRLARSEVARIHDMPRMGLVLAGQGLGLAVVLPPYLEKPDEVRALLSAWAPVHQSTAGSEKRGAVLGGLLSLLGGLVWVALWFGVGLFSDIRLAMASGVTMLALDVWFLRVLVPAGSGSLRRAAITMMVIAGLSVPARLLLHFWHP